MKFLIAYATYSGNTKEAAELIADFLEESDHAVGFHWIGGEPVPDVSEFDALILGSFTWAEGSVPEEVKDFILDVGYKPANTFVFGTGDTQFGGDALFCRAAVKLARFYESPLPPLKIEQSPRGGQEMAVREWTASVAEGSALERQCTNEMIGIPNEKINRLNEKISRPNEMMGVIRDEASARSTPAIPHPPIERGHHP